MKTLTKESLAVALADTGKYTKVEANAIVDTVVKTLQNALVEGERIELRGLFVVANRKTPKRVARNPKTGVEVTIPERILPRMKPSPELVARINTK